MQAWSNIRLAVFMLMSTCLVSCESFTNTAVNQKGSSQSKCSNRYCIDLNCVPCQCPRLIKFRDLGSGFLQDKFASMVSFLNANMDLLPSSCNMELAIQPVAAVSVCSLDNVPPSPATQFFDASIAVKAAAVNRGPIPAGAIIYSSNIVVINGFYWNQVIFFYLGQYCYISYNTGIRIITALRLTITNSVSAESMKSGAIPTETSDFRRLERKIRQGGFGEGMVASDLTTILRCVPGALQFNQVRCLSPEVLPTILLNS